MWGGGVISGFHGFKINGEFSDGGLRKMKACCSFRGLSEWDGLDDAGLEDDRGGAVAARRMPLKAPQLRMRIFGVRPLKNFKKDFRGSRRSAPPSRRALLSMNAGGHPTQRRRRNLVAMEWRQTEAETPQFRRQRAEVVHYFF